MRWLVGMAIAALGIAPAALAQAPAAGSLKVGSAALTLGMPEKPALAALERSYRVERARGAGDNWTVAERNGETIAVVSFSNGKLDRAAKTWYASNGRQAAALADRLYALASDFAAEGRTECALSAKPYRLGTAQGNIVTLACGSKSLQLNRLRMGGGRVSTSLREVLQ